jgi:hypothetical protein
LNYVIEFRWYTAIKIRKLWIKADHCGHVENQPNTTPVFTPNFLRITAIGQKPVNADCSKFAPTNPVKNSQYGLWTIDKITLNRIKLPATAKMKRSIVMGTSSLKNVWIFYAYLQFEFVFGFLDPRKKKRLQKNNPMFDIFITPITAIGKIAGLGNEKSDWLRAETPPTAPLCGWLALSTMGQAYL